MRCENFFCQWRRPFNYLVDWRHSDFTVGSQEIQKGRQILWRSASSLWRPPQCLKQNPLRILTDLWSWTFISQLRHWPIHLLTWPGSRFQDRKVDLEAIVWIWCDVEFKFRLWNRYMAEFWIRRRINSSLWLTVLKSVIQSFYYSSVGW